MIEPSCRCAVCPGDTGKAFDAAQAKSPSKTAPAASALASPGVPARASKGIDQGELSSVRVSILMRGHHDTSARSGLVITD